MLIPKGLVWLFLGLLLVIGAASGYAAFTAHRTHSYLGTNKGGQAQWKGFIGQYQSDAIVLRTFFKNLNCRLLTLENKPCPTGPPSTSPKNPPAYP